MEKSFWAGFKKFRIPDSGFLVLGGKPSRVLLSSVISLERRERNGLQEVYRTDSHLIATIQFTLFSDRAIVNYDIKTIL